MRKLLLVAFTAATLAYPLRADTSAEDIGRKIDEKLATAKENLKLTPEQKTRINAILKEKEQRLKEFSDDAARRIRAVLTPEQRQSLDNEKKSGS
jgi:periplasmic protein CpxP/Spy